MGCIDGVSKAGNAKVIVTIRDVETDYEEELHLVAEPKKRWFLKNLLDACGVSAAENGVYNWSHKDIIGQKVSGLVEHEPNEWINREGETVKGTQHRFVEFKQVAWDE